MSQVPTGSTEFTVGFYNVGLNKNQVNKKGWKIKERKLKEDIVNAFEKHSLDVLCLCELGELSDGLSKFTATATIALSSRQVVLR